MARVGAEPRRAELLAALSLAVDLGLGQPMEHMLRSSVIATRLADHLGLDADQRATVYYSSLVMWIGCHADSHEYAGWFGDDIAVRRDAYQLDWSGLPYTWFLVRNVGRGRPLPQRVQTLATLFMDARGRLANLIHSHCLSAGLLADRIGLGDAVRDALTCTFERWDGGGLPAGTRGDGIPVAMRVAQLADVAEVHYRQGGVAAARGMARERSGRQFDPEVVAAFEGCVDALFDGLAQVDAWGLALEHAPDRDWVLTRDEVEVLLQAMGDFVDLKCPFTFGHSRGVAALAAAAGECHGLPAAEVALLRRAGHVHDLGRIGVSNQIWEKPGPLSATEWERVRLHPYLTRRILDKVPGLEAEAALAEAHHERQDGSGYPRGVDGSGLGVPERLLAAAESYHSSTEPRPYRAGLDPQDAAIRLTGEARAGRLEAQAVDAVLEAAGHRRRRRSAWPDGLTNREVEVLRLVARARSNREIAAALFISEKTVRNHVEHVYTKIGVSNRTGASLYAVQHGLTGSFPDPVAD
ncbi:MAG TPA: HD domain-containing phosphohydrolase [Nocardioidaceae bacterium]|nr:HD domain-containing phosphohydrolase [Nocardioidaceae bacterium]